MCEQNYIHGNRKSGAGCLGEKNPDRFLVFALRGVVVSAVRYFEAKFADPYTI